MVSLIFGGCLDFGRKLTVDKSHATIDYLLSRGIKSLDTASCYSDGKSEVFMGLHPACNDPERTIITTKGTVTNLALFSICPGQISHDAILCSQCL